MTQKTTKPAQAAEQMRSLNRFYDIAFQHANLPREPYHMRLDDSFGLVRGHHLSVKDTPFSPEEAHLQYSTLWFRDYYTSDSIIRLHVKNENNGLNSNGKRAHSGSDTDGPQEPPKAKKKISLSEYKARSKAGTTVSTPVVAPAAPHVEPEDKSKEASKDVAVVEIRTIPTEATSNVAVVEPKEILDEHKKTDEASAMTHEQDKKVTDVQENMSEKKKESDEDHEQQTSLEPNASDRERLIDQDLSPPKTPLSLKSQAGRKRFRDEVAFDESSSSDETTHERPSKTARLAATSAKTSDTAIAIKGTTFNKNDDTKSMVLGTMPVKGLNLQAPWLTPPRDDTPSSPDTIGARKLSSASSAESSQVPEVFDVWNPDSDVRIRSTGPSPSRTPLSKPVNAAKTDTKSSPAKHTPSRKADHDVKPIAPINGTKQNLKPLPAATALTSKPLVSKSAGAKAGPAQQASIPAPKKERKVVPSGNSAFFQQLSSGALAPVSRPLTPVLARPRTVSSVTRPTTPAVPEKRARYFIKLKYGKRNTNAVTALLAKPSMPKATVHHSSQQSQVDRTSASIGTLESQAEIKTSNKAGEARKTVMPVSKSSAAAAEREQKSGVSTKTQSTSHEAHKHTLPSAPTTESKGKTYRPVTKASPLIKKRQREHTSGEEAGFSSSQLSQSTQSTPLRKVDSQTDITRQMENAKKLKQRYEALIQSPKTRSTASIKGVESVLGYLQAHIAQNTTTQSQAKSETELMDWPSMVSMLEAGLETMKEMRARESSGTKTNE